MAIISQQFWQKKFSRRNDVLGQSVILNGEPHEIVGVMPEGFDFPRREVQIWVPAALDDAAFQQNLDAHFLRVVGRLKADVTPERLRAEVALLGTRVNAPEDDTVRKFQAVSLHEVMAGDLRQPLLVLLSAVVFLLLIACANVANLMLARASAREDEMAVRSALGASRSRLLAQLLTEAGVLAVSGGAVGLAIAFWGLDLLRSLAADNLPELLHARIDGWTVGCALVITLASGLLMGLGPALAATRQRVQDGWKGGTRATGNANAARTRQVLVFAEIALACVLLVGCGLMMRSFVALVRADPGFRSENVLTASTELLPEQYPTAPELLRYYRAALAALAALPNVESIGAVTHLPFSGNGWGNSYEVEGQPPAPGAQSSAQIRPISPGYLATLNIPLRQGRPFTADDNENAPAVAIVNQRFAERSWPNETPIGKRVRYSKGWLSVVGVCGNIKHTGLDAEVDAEIYVPYAQLPPEVITFVGRSLYFVVRSKTPASVAPLLRGAIRTLDPGLVVKVNAMDAMIHDSVAQPRFRTWLIGVVSAFALGLAGLGLYGVVAYLVSQRYREIGIRIALGATRRDILHLVLGRTLWLTSLGIFAGLAAAFFLSRFLRSLLFEISGHDAFTFSAVPAGLLVVALLAAYLPARRAVRVDPMISLRCE